MALTSKKSGNRAAFTLVELLVVIGLMAVLATISIAGYNAANRGMAEHGVIQSTVSILRIAKQTCQIDRVPTKVLFFNRRLTDDDTVLGQGTAIAIKQAGRITVNPSVGLLIDEFADWNQSYPASGLGSAPPMRLYNMSEDDATLVEPFVTAHELRDRMLQAGTTIDQWCDTHGRKANKYVWGFKVKSGGGWKVGDAYGVEIARVDLTKGYIFGSKEPSASGDLLQAASVKEVSFNPEEADPNPSGSVLVSALRQGAGGKTQPVKVDTVTSDMLKEGKN